MEDALCTKRAGQLELVVSRPLEHEDCGCEATGFH